MGDASDEETSNSSYEARESQESNSDGETAESVNPPTSLPPDVPSASSFKPVQISNLSDSDEEISDLGRETSSFKPVDTSTSSTEGPKNVCQKLRLAHQNIRSCEKKANEIELMLHVEQLDILCLSETWLNKSSNYTVPKGFHFYKKDRAFEEVNEKRGGGVGILCKRTIEVTECCIVENNFKLIDFMCQQMNVGFGKTFIVAVVYIPPKDVPTADMENLKKIIQKLNSSGKSFFVMGDFNIDFLGKAKQTKEMKQLFATYSLRQLVKHPTRNVALLDYIVTNDKTVTAAQVKNFRISDHLLCAFEYNYETVTPELTDLYKEATNFSSQYIAKQKELNCLNVEMKKTMGKIRQKVEENKTKRIQAEDVKKHVT